MPDVTMSARLRRALSPRNIGAIYIFVALFVLFALWVPDTFLTKAVWRTLFDQGALTAMVAMALVLPLAAGAVNLAVGAELGFGAIVVAWLLAKQNVPVVPAIVGTVAVGCAIGAISGLLVTRAHRLLHRDARDELSAAGGDQLGVGQPADPQPRVLVLGRRHRAAARPDVPGVDDVDDCLDPLVRDRPDRRRAARDGHRGLRRDARHGAHRHRRPDDLFQGTARWGGAGGRMLARARARSGGDQGSTTQDQRAAGPVSVP